MLAYQCGCPAKAWLPILVKSMRGGRQFIFTHCVACGVNITWMGGTEEKVKQNDHVKDVSDVVIRPEQMEWYRKKMAKK